MKIFTTYFTTLPSWAKTTAASWVSTLTGVGLFDWLSINHDAITSIAAIIGGIVIPGIALLINTFKKKDK